MFCRSGHCLCRTLQTQSTQVWNDLQDAVMLGSPYHEDTVTQSLALHLNRHHPAENRVHIFTGPRKESRNGSDFIWLLFDLSLSRYFPLAVQAKRLYPSGRYDAFKAHQVGKISTYAKIIGGFPIYLLYNYPPMVAGLWKIWSSRRPDWPITALDYPRDLGLTYVHADLVSGIGDGKLDPSDIAATCFPMWTPFCHCHATSSDDPLENIWEAFTSWSKPIETMPDGPQETPQLLMQWKQGGEVSEDGLRDVMRLPVGKGDEGFAPSFMLGTTLGGLR